MCVVTLKALSCEALTWDNKAAVGISVSPVNPLALILPQMKSRHLATGEETLLRLIKRKVAVAHKMLLSRCSAREDGGWRDGGMSGFFFSPLFDLLNVRGATYFGINPKSLLWFLRCPNSGSPFIQHGC